MFKKVFAAMLAGLFISAPAFAEVKMSGSYFIKGNYFQDNAGHDYRVYESDLEVKTKIIVNENTSVDVVAEAFDTQWLSQENIDGGEANDAGQNYFEVSKATMTHKFATNTTFMGGISANADTWGTAFGDDASRIYFIQADQALPFGTLTVKTEKWSEGTLANDGDDDTKNKDNQDADGYLLGLTMNAGDFTIQPGVYYFEDKENNLDVTKLMVAATGKVNAFDIESEFGYADDGDFSAFGAWVDAATNVANIAVNAGLIYASTDDAFAFVVGDELCPMEILGDDIGIDGTTLIRVKAAKSITEKVGVDASAAYAFTNYDDAFKAANATFDAVYELNANASYKASDVVTLSTGIAYLDGDDANENAYEDARIDAYAKINVAF